MWLIGEYGSAEVTSALQREAEISRAKMGFWAHHTRRGGLGGISQGTEKGPRDSKWILDHCDFKKVSEKCFYTFWNNTSFMQEINKFRVFIPVTEENLKDVFNFQSDRNLIPYATRLLIKYKTTSCFLF